MTMSGSLIPHSNSPEPNEPLQQPGEEPRAGDGAHHGRHDPHDERDRQSLRKPWVPTTEDCLGALGQLPGLVALKLLKPSEANALRAVYHEILEHQRRTASHDAAGGLADRDVLDLAREDPRRFAMLEPLLSDEQIAMVAKDAAETNDAADGHHGEA